MRIWSTEHGTEVAQLTGHRAYIKALAFDPVHRRLVTGSGDTTVRVWETSSLADRMRSRQEYTAIATRLAARVEALAARLGAAEAARVLAADGELTEREREIADHLCWARELRGQ
ncbi:MAG: hypothetical protein AAF628_31875 [Planctomycetota bacterium]